jgi:hypothetical protein
MHRRTLALCLVTVLLALGGCKKKANEERVRGSGVGSTVSRPVEPFTRLVVGSSLDVTVTVGKHGPMELRGDDNLIKLVPSKVVNGELVLKPEVPIKTKQPLRITLLTERLDRVALAVATKVVVHGVRSDAFEVEAGGAAKITADGSAARLSVKSRNAARVDLSAFSVGEAQVTADNFSRVTLGHVEKLDVTQRENSVITYRGTPDIKQQADKSSHVAASN